LLASKSSRFISSALAALVACCMASGASAETGDVNIHLELGPAFPLGGWQAEELGTGLGAAGRVELALAGWVGVEAGAGYTGFHQGEHPDGYQQLDGASMVTGSLGARFRILNDERGYLWSWGDKPGHTGNFLGNLWVDIHGNYYNTGGASRWGGDAGLGAEASVVNGLQLGPFARVAYVYQPDGENRRDSQDAWLLVAGLSGSVALPPSGAMLPDTDGDGMYDQSDVCPESAEDVDGFEDADGCPDDDNDGDSIPDSSDGCPESAEDVDGFEDADGCPDDDNDGDSIPDSSDGCPDSPEDADGFEDADGCPDDDNDKDGVPDAEDSCPVDPETIDGVDDKDGCPEPDEDRDGIADPVDRCPEIPETVNGIEDEDGCPDEGLVEVVEDRILGGSPSMDTRTGSDRRLSTGPSPSRGPSG